MTDHDIALTVNRLRDIAKEYGQTQQLRDRIAAVVVPLLSASKPAAPQTEWQLIDGAPKTGRTLLLGYLNSAGKWRTVRGQWMSEAYIAEQWEEPDDAEPGWYETSVEADDPPNCWPITPTHWMPLPAAPDHIGDTDEKVSVAARDVLAERQRQVDAEGWTSEHDDEHSSGDIATAAACYAASAGGVPWSDDVPSFWPWADEWWKPTTARRDLVKAGALILAEIERIDRAAPIASAGDQGSEG
jgi:hypothetical protein